MKILVVEDDFGSRLVLQKMLGKYGTCDVAVNGNEAVASFGLALAEGEPYDLICLDIMMPELSGREALGVIRKMEKDMKILPKHEVKIVMMTALDMAKDVIDAYYNGGCTSYMVKPIQKANVVKMLKELGFIQDEAGE